MSYWGDFPLEQTLNFLFTTRAFATGIPTVLAGTPVLSIYEDTNLTPITAGVTVTVDHDGVVGLNRANAVATAANGYEAGKTYTAVITTGTVGGVSVVGEVVGHFTIDRSAALRPTTAGRTIDIAATGEAGLDFGNVVGTLSGGQLAAGAFGADAITAAAIATDAIGSNELATTAINEIRDAVTGGAYALDTDGNGAIRIVDGTGVREINTNAGAIALVDLTTTTTTATNLTNLPSIPANWLTAAGIAASALDGKGDWNTTTPPTAAANADAVWDELMSDHQIDASFGLAANVLDAGTATGGAAGTITLDADTASATGDLYNRAIISTVGGTGAGQTRRITDYSVTSRIASVEPNWITNPGAGTKYVVTGGGNADLRTATQVSVDEIEGDTSELQGDWVDGGRLDLLLDAVSTTADLLDKVGSVSEAAAAGDPSATESVMQYVKQIVNVLTGTTGIVTMPAAAAPANNVSIAEMVRSIYDDTNSLDGTKIPDTVSLTNINAEVDTALGTTTYAEPAKGAPGATLSLAAKIGFLHKAWRNRSTMTASVYSLYSDDATTVDHDAAVSDAAGTAERSEMTDGP